MALHLTKPIPPQIVNEGATYGPLKLNDFIESTSKLSFYAELADGRSLPNGLICMTDGLINGIPGKETEGVYKIIVSASNEEGEQLTIEFDLTINPRLKMDEKSQIYSKLKAEVWDALGKNLPLPELNELLNRPITITEIYYLLQRFATLTIWDVYNLDSPDEKRILQLEGMNKYYDIYDRGCCIVGAPKDLFSHERTLEDALQTARAMAKEVYKRGWVIEFAGFDKMVRSAWVELQLLGDKYGKRLEVLHFSPSLRDLQIYREQAKDIVPAPSPGQEF